MEPQYCDPAEALAVFLEGEGFLAGTYMSAYPDTGCFIHAQVQPGMETHIDRTDQVRFTCYGRAPDDPKTYLDKALTCIGRGPLTTPDGNYLDSVHVVQSPDKKSLADTLDTSTCLVAVTQRPQNH